MDDAKTAKGRIEAAKLAKLYPSAMRFLWEQASQGDQDDCWHPINVALARSPEVELEKALFYIVLTTTGPDILWARIGRALPKARKQLPGHDIAPGALARAFENGNSIYRALDKAGLFGPASDALRSDKFFS